MNSTTHPARTSRSAHRVLPALTIAALAIGLAACQTPPQNAQVVEKPEVVSVTVPRGVEQNRTADRLAEQLQRRARDTRRLTEQMRGMPADRIAEQIDRLSGGPAPKEHVPTWTDRILAQIEFEKTHPAATRPERFDGMTADR